MTLDDELLHLKSDVVCRILRKEGLHTDRGESLVLTELHAGRSMDQAYANAVAVASPLREGNGPTSLLGRIRHWISRILDPH